MAPTTTDNSHNNFESCCTKVRRSLIAHEISCHNARFIAQQVLCMTLKTVEVPTANIWEHNLIGSLELGLTKFVKS